MSSPPGPLAFESTGRALFTSQESCANEMRCHKLVLCHRALLHKCHFSVSLSERDIKYTVLFPEPPVRSCFVNDHWPLVWWGVGEGPLGGCWEKPHELVLQCLGLGLRGGGVNFSVGNDSSNYDCFPWHRKTRGCRPLKEKKCYINYSLTHDNLLWLKSCHSPFHMISFNLKSSSFAPFLTHTQYLAG